MIVRRRRGGWGWRFRNSQTSPSQMVWWAMANGKPGDHSLSDYLAGYARPFQDDICSLIDQIRAADPEAFYCKPSSGPFSLEEDARVNGDWLTWEKGEELDEARAFLELKLRAAKEKSGEQQ